jgi:hypothetical protein
MVNALVANSRLLVTLLAFPLVQACSSLYKFVAGFLMHYGYRTVPF